MEVAAPGDGLVRIRDSKDPDGPQLTVTVECWQRSLSRFTGQQADQGGQTLAADHEPGSVVLRQAGGAALSFTRREWDAFLAGVRQGEFAVTATGFAIASPAAMNLSGPLA